MVVSELRGEKIDIIPWNNEPARFVAKALSPARVREVYLDDDGKEATVVVPDDQLALAIGKEGMNARLAARLTGWKIDIQSDTEFAQAEAEVAFGGGGGEEELSGRCSAILANGKRCPNASLPGSRFCGVPAHQALEGSGSDYVGGIAAEEAAKAKLAEEEAALDASDAPSTTSVEGMIAEATPEATDSAIERRPSDDARAPRRRRFAEVGAGGRGCDAGGGSRRGSRRGGNPGRGVDRTSPFGAASAAAGARRNASCCVSRPLDGTLVQGREAPGRGAYTCRRLACFERAQAQRGFARALRQGVRVDPALSRLYTYEEANG